MSVSLFSKIVYLEMHFVVWFSTWICWILFCLPLCSTEKGSSKHTNFLCSNKLQCMTVLIKILTKVSLHLEIIDNDILESTSYVAGPFLRIFPWGGIF